MRFSKNGLTLVFCLLFALFFLLFPTTAVTVFSAITNIAIQWFDEVFLYSASLILILCFIIAFSPLGKIKLGKADQPPEFSRFSWSAMLFAAGMGSGLVFWGVAEPIYHLNAPINPTHSEDIALAITYFNWGLHAWGIYAIAGLVIAWFFYKKQRSMTVSAGFNEMTNLAPGASRFYFLDVIAVLAIIFGVAGTLANTIALIQTGVNKSLGMEIDSLAFRLSLLAVIVFCFTASSVSGLKRGVKWLSNFNIVFAGLILVVMLVLVDFSAIVAELFTSSMTYLKMLPSLSFSIPEGAEQWSHGWTIIYLIWWIAWAPFVGLFIARISKGRSIREFLLSVILIPTTLSMIWFAAFGGGAFALPETDAIINAVNTDYTLGLFTFFQQLPLTTLFSLSMILLLITFVITSADSAIYVTALLTENNSTKTKLMWSLVLSAITIALLYKNDVDLNKTIAISGAIPYMLILIVQILILIKSMLNSKS